MCDRPKTCGQPAPLPPSREMPQTPRPHKRLPARYLSVRWAPQRGEAYSTLRYRLKTGLFLEQRMAKIRRAAERYWRERSNASYDALTTLSVAQGAWLTTPVKDYDRVLVLDPHEAAKVAGTSKERLYAPGGTYFARYTSAQEALFRDLRGKRLLGVLAGGIGDLILYAQLCRQLRTQYGAHIDVGYYKSLQPDDLLPRLYAPAAGLRFPVVESVWRSYDFILPLGVYRVLNGETLSEYFFRCYGIRFAVSGFYFDTETQENVERRLVHRHGFDLQRPIIFIQGGCRGPKNYPHFGAVAEQLVALGHQVAVIGGAENSVGRDQAGKLADLCGMPVWDTICAMQFATLAVTPDSAFLHAAGALSKPTLAVFGPTPPIWAQPYPLTTAVAFPNMCRFLPCWAHDETRPPCGVAVNRPCLADIPPEEIVALALRKLAGELGTNLYELPRMPRRQIVEDVSR